MEVKKVSKILEIFFPIFTLGDSNNRGSVEFQFFPEVSIYVFIYYTH